VNERNGSEFTRHVADADSRRNDAGDAGEGTIKKGVSRYRSSRAVDLLGWFETASEDFAAVPGDGHHFGPDRKDGRENQWWIIPDICSEPAQSNRDQSRLVLGDDGASR
jgi:hypothetical protein